MANIIIGRVPQSLWSYKEGKFTFATDYVLHSDADWQFSHRTTMPRNTRSFKVFARGKMKRAKIRKESCAHKFIAASRRTYIKSRTYSVFAQGSLHVEHSRAKGKFSERCSFRFRLSIEKNLKRSDFNEQSNKKQNSCSSSYEILRLI
jgi:hypothetical protein